MSAAVMTPEAALLRKRLSELLDSARHPVHAHGRVLVDLDFAAWIAAVDVAITPPPRLPLAPSDTDARGVRS